ncbi:hypothetical protein ACHAWF_004228 [Thalassiosira exigua]
MKDAGDAGQPEPALSEYEQARARNIEKNNARLRSLGLITAAEERRSNDIAWGRHDSRNDGESSDSDRDEDSSSDEEYTEGAKAPKRKKRSKSRAPPREGSRKSRRLMNLPSELGGEFATPNETPSERKERKERLRKERQAMVEECREARQRAAVEVAKAGVEMAGKENPTATYEHCLMRVRSMSEKGLANRVRAIERAAGKHCVVKMAIFKSCLQDQNMWELARLASEALERLKGLLPPPPL